MKVLYKITLIGTVFSFSTMSCQSSAKPANVSGANRPSNTNSSLPKDLPSPENSPAGKPDDQETFAKLFSGTIGDEDADSKSKIPPFQMRLKRVGTQLTGVYRYKNSNKDISLQGKVDDDDKFILTESIGGKATGQFDGSFENTSEGLLKMSGVWSKPNSDESIGFSADEVPMDMSGNVYLDEKSLSEKNSRVEMAISYPQITGATAPNVTKLNQAIQAIGVKYQNDFKKSAPSAGENASIEVGYTIHFADDNLFSIEFVDDSFSGGAHPNHSTITLNYDLKAGKALQLADLFKPGSKYLDKLSALSLASIKNDLGEGIFEEGIKPLPKNYNNWVVGREGLTIFFDEYQAAPYASGRQEVSIEFAEIKDMINEHGPIATLAK